MTARIHHPATGFDARGSVRMSAGAKMALTAPPRWPRPRQEVGFPHAGTRTPRAPGDALPAAARRGAGARHPDRVRGPLRLQPRRPRGLRRHGLLLLSGYLIT